MCTYQCMVRSRNICIRYICITTFVTRIKQLTWLESFAWGYYQWVHLHNLSIKCVLGRLQILCGCVLDCVWLYILWWGLFLLCIWVCFLCFFPLYCFSASLFLCSVFVFGPCGGLVSRFGFCLLWVLACWGGGGGWLSVCCVLWRLFPPFCLATS